MTTRLEMFRGDDESFDVVVTEADEVTRVDLSGADLRFTAKRKITDEDDAAIIVLTTTDSTITLTDAAQGEARLDVPAVQTDSLTKDSLLFWDLQVFDIADKTRTVASGQLIVRRDVSRTTP
jgi:hypothetical protein